MAAATAESKTALWKVEGISLYQYELSTSRSGLFEITEQVLEAVKASGVSEGVSTVFVPHTTAGVVIVSKMDDLGLLDIEEEICRLVPTRIDFKHQFDTPSDASGHIKSALTGVSVSVPIANGKLQLGPSQGIYFFEFDGPRKRQFYLQTYGCSER